MAQDVYRGYLFFGNIWGFKYRLSSALTMAQNVHNPCAFAHMAYLFFIKTWIVKWRNPDYLIRMHQSNETQAIPFVLQVKQTQSTCIIGLPDPDYKTAVESQNKT